MPGAIPRTAATRLSPPPTSRFGSPRPRRRGLSINPARIDGGSPNNVVPDLAVLRVNMRPATLEDRGSAAQALIDDAVAEVAAEHDVAHPRSRRLRAARPSR